MNRIPFPDRFGSSSDVKRTTGFIVFLSCLSLSLFFQDISSSCIFPIVLSSGLEKLVRRCFFVQMVKKHFNNSSDSTGGKGNLYGICFKADVRSVD